MTNATSVPTALPDAPTVDVLALQNRFRANTAAIVAAEKGDYTGLLPGWHNIPEHLQFDRLKDALARMTADQAHILHQLQAASTGPRKKTTASPEAKAKAISEAKAKTTSILDSLDF